MQIKETLSKSLKREFEIKIPAKEVEKKLIARLELIGKKAKIPGFRPGKVPLAILKQRYKAEALSEVLEKCIEDAIAQTIKEKGIKPSLSPKVDLKSYEEDKDLEFNVSMDILPTIGDINLEGFTFEKYVVDVPSTTVSKVVENIAKKHRTTRPLKKLRETRKGDIVIIDFEGFIEDNPIKGGSGKEHSLELGSGAFIPGFEDQLIGHHKGSNVTVRVTFPKDYHEDSYANKPARFEVTILDIHEADPLVVDAELAQKLGFDSLEGMHEYIEKNIQNDSTAHSFINTKRHVLDALAERFAFDVPENMVELEFKNIWDQLCYEMDIPQTDAANTNVNEKEQAKVFKERTGRSEEDLRKEYKVIAERRVRLGLLLAEIGARNKLTLSNQEILNGIIAKAKEFPGQEKEVFDFYRNNKAAMDSLKAPLFEDKVVNFILGQSKVTEKKVTPEELEKLLAVEEEEAEKKVASESKKPKQVKKKKES